MLKYLELIEKNSKIDRKLAVRLCKTSFPIKTFEVQTKQRLVRLHGSDQSTGSTSVQTERSIKEFPQLFHKYTDIQSRPLHAGTDMTKFYEKINHIISNIY